MRLHINLTHSRTLRLLAAGAGAKRYEALCHYVLAVERQSVHQPQYAGEKSVPWRNVTIASCTVLLTRAGVFDKAVFSSLVLTLLG